MNRNPMQTIFSKKFWLLCIAVGIFLLGIVFALSRQADMQNCEQRLAGAIEFIKEQAADYTKYNETAIAKGLVREAAAVHTLESLSLDCDEAALSERAKELWLTGICLLDAQGELVCEYTENGIGYAQLQSGIKLESILSVIDYPQKTYVKHMELDDGSFADVAVHSCADGAGAVLAYCYTGAEFSQKSVLSIQPLIDSYGVNSTGTLLVVEENRVSASNDPTLIGMNIFESERLMSIRRSNRADKLIRVYAPRGIEQCYGMYSHGRNYSLYAYVPARQVYDLTVMNLVVTLVMYILILAFVQGFRWNSAKDFFMQQENSEQEYKKSLEQKNAALELAVQRETKANLAKREFLFNMSHDIRTPMNAIIGFTHLMEKSLGDADKCRDYLMKIQKSSGFLLSLINNVLEMARIDSGKVVLEETPCDVQQARGQLESVYGEMMKQKHINFEVSNYMRAKYVFMDAVKMNQVFLNLISNAYKYTPEGGRVRVETVELPCDKPGCVTIRTKVSDTGIGMSKDYLPHLFEEFTRERTATDNKILGTGLGMPIVKKLVELMGGTIEVESEPGRGTTFTVTTTHRVAQQEVVSCEEHAEGSLPSLAGRRVLLAEDNDLNAEIAVAILQEAGLLVERAADGVECVRMLQQAPSDYFSLILMDIQMPRLNGYEAARQIRQLGDRAKAQVPILAMTANAFEEDRQNALKAGMNGHLAKPIDVPLLLKTISEFIVRS